ncbi:alpha-glucosidase [Tomitella fengzijianii]|uniref:alpha-glucosidase n=1 Tax=Tomitella fengzijianii TaxID=2597660 RepID=UPI00131C07D7|nr:alpha-glucosidase [Tomitella fengzijianii]
MGAVGSERPADDRPRTLPGHAVSRRALLRSAVGIGAGVLVAGMTSLSAPPATRAGVPFLRYAPAPVLPLGRLTVAPSAVGTVDAGTFRVVVAPGSVRVESGGRAVFASPAGAFLASANGRLNWQENTGHFSFTPALTSLQLDQEVRRVEVDDGAVVLTGILAPPVDLGPQSSEIATAAPFDLATTRKFTLRVSTGPHGLELRADVPGAEVVVLRPARGPGEGVHGAGEQFTGFDLTGDDVPIVTREQGVGRGREPLTAAAEATQGAGGSPTTTYAPLPFLATDAMRAFALDTDVVATFDCRPPDRIDIAAWAPGYTTTVYAGAVPKDLLESHTADTGRMRALPEWSGAGAILGLQGGTDAVTAKLAALEDAGAAVTGVWLQDWSGQRTTDFGERLWWNWVLDRDRYPRWDAFVSSLNDRGIKVLTYVNAFLADPAGKPGGTARNLFAEANARGYLVGHPSGGPYLLDQGGFDAALVDLTNPAAVAWFRDVIATEVAGVGADGWMADFGEGLPFDAVLHAGSPAEWHNRWPVAWAELNDAARRQAGRPDALVFFRAAGRGSAAHAPLFWAGDQLVTWDADDGLASALRGMLAGGVSGMALTHSDTGGYTGLSQPVVGVRRARELLLRWAEFSAWGTVMRTHEGNQPDRNAQAYDPDAAVGFAEQTRVFAALADYRRGVVAEAAQTGVPALRHPWIGAPGSPAAARDDQFLFGSGIFVAPAMAPGLTRTTATLPPGDWVHVWTGEQFAGDADVTVDSPLGRPAAFHRSGDPAAEEAARRVRAAVQ